ncbi:MAG TPA: DUF929 family protein [Nitrososphaeraceae archaeon]|nr:DUF929 family protein [Nitrososphaeraceae archaeon]
MIIKIKINTPKKTNEICESLSPKIILGKFMHINDSSWKTNNGKKLIFFLGAGFCPYCAAGRWAIVEGLRKFGEWKELIENHSASTNEKFLNIATFDFSHSKYESSFGEFRGIEIADRDSKAKEKLEKIDKEILGTYNPDHLIPFLLIDGQFMQFRTGINPESLEKLNHEEIRKIIRDENSVVGKSIIDESNIIASLICKSIDNIPENIKDKQIIELFYKIK